MNPKPSLRAVRGEILHFLSDPAVAGAAALQHFSDGILAIRDGHVVELGPADDMLAKLPSDIVHDDYRGQLILPGFVDTHTHYAQTDIIASHGEQLLAWLEKYTFPAEARFADPAHAATVANFFCDELLRNGTTTVMAFATVHASSVDALFEAALQRRMRLITGKVLMDRNCPPELRDCAASGEAESRTLIERWHGRERLLYAVTPRFACTSTPAQMESAARLFAQHPGLYLQSHLAQSRGEVEWTARLHPAARSYLDVYDGFGQLGARSMYAHCIWLDDVDRARMATTGSAMSFCPTSNLFLGSGLFDLERARALGVRVGLGTDVGAGTSFSMLETMDEAYKVLHLRGQKLTPFNSFYRMTLGNARALGLENEIGSLHAGADADIVVLDSSGKSAMEYRMRTAKSLLEELFILQTMGDDRCVAEVYIAGKPMKGKGKRTAAASRLLESA